MQVSTHDRDTPAANKQHKIEDQLPEYFNHGRILAPLKLRPVSQFKVLSRTNILV